MVAERAPGRQNGRDVRQETGLQSWRHKKMGTTRVPISEFNWLLNLGSNQGPTD